MPPEQPVVENHRNWKKYWWVGLVILLVLGGMYAYGAYLNVKKATRIKQTSDELAIEQKLLVQGIILPPDPGEAGKETLEGIDLDKDGVRDDVQRWIITTYSEPIERTAVLQYAKALQRTEFLSTSTAENIAYEQRAGVRCIAHIFSHTDWEAISIETRARMLNTPERLRNYEQLRRNAIELEIPPIRISELAQYCNISEQDISSWQTYRNEEYGFELEYPNYLKVGQKTNPSQFGDEHNYMDGVYIGPLAFFIADTDDKERESSENFYAKINYISEDTGDGPTMNCNSSTKIVNPNVGNIEYYTCGGDGGSSLHGLILGEKYNVVIYEFPLYYLLPDGYKFTQEYYEKSSEIMNLILSTFRFIEPTKTETPVACTADAMMCPDGSYVGRSGPNCKFICP